MKQKARALFAKAPPLTHLAQESHSMCVSCIGSLGEVVKRPLVDRQRNTLSRKHSKTTQKPDRKSTW